MISHGEGFILRHRTGRYFKSIVESLGFAAGTPKDRLPPIMVSYQLVESPFIADHLFREEPWHRFLSGGEWSYVAEQFNPVPGPGCSCCGERYGYGSIYGEEANWRCEKHKDRNPCAVEGCKRTTAAPEGRLATDSWLCSEHWKRACPPHSLTRRLYNKLWRMHKRQGYWKPEHVRLVNRLWDRILKKARSTDQETLDVAEINRLFGWTE